MKFLVSNIGGRAHQDIFSVISEGAFFDLAPGQHGWNDYVQIRPGDVVYVINQARRVETGFCVLGIVDGVTLKKDEVWGEKVKSMIGGNLRVLFGEPVEDVGQDYSDFVDANNIRSPKINPSTGKMYPGFNCTKFSEDL
ncbi:hypothetical protein [Microbulbifer sp. YPW16]|uniref:hypothetical protein n=1 Tax=Microbulbifer sp. YPW16 TaxID=2904242 RepID=UPI001E4CD3A7|nr:hypothetical protein [Microbulbifer sp. YPW16]UHQ54147.1 hypothetical protein LVE68_11520 [Microbulbifer sp. YPW16]